MMTGNEYITTTNGLRGFFAVLIVNNEPWSTGVGSYATAEEAEEEARAWAEADGIEYRKGKA